jgi:hypothetical protein
MIPSSLDYPKAGTDRVVKGASAFISTLDNPIGGGYRNANSRTKQEEDALKKMSRKSDIFVDNDRLAQIIIA